MASHFRTNWTHVLFTALPPAVDPASAVAFLHDHEALIKLSPLVTSYHQTSSDGRRVSYDIRERISVLPRNLWDQEIQFSAVFEDRENGLWSELHAPLGLVSEVTYEVMQVKDESRFDVVDHEGEAIVTQWMLKETIDSSCNIAFKSFVDASMVPTRRKMAERLMNKLEGGIE
ncbi:hypothetical protein MBLNU459_g1045t1 [Dothideomycetes sp. NU459]